MAHNVEMNLDPADSRRLEGLAWPVFGVSLVVGILALLLALGAALLMGEEGIKRFGFAYLTNYAFFLSLSLGALFFVVATHLFRAGWCVLVRRVAEILAAIMPALALLFLPVLLYAYFGGGMLYPWAQDWTEIHGHEEAHELEHGPDILAPDVGEHGGAESHGDPAGAPGAAPVPHAESDVPDHPEPAAAEPLGPEQEQVPAHQYRRPDVMTKPIEVIAGSHEDAALAHLMPGKTPYLNLPFFTVRWVLYLGIWSAMGLWYWRTSTRQDLTGEANLTKKMEGFSAPGAVIFGVTITFASFDLLMSLDPTWFSSMFGVYFFAGSFQAGMAALIVLVMLLQWQGFLPSVTREHYHDMGKLMYAWVIFWAYIAFAQYMLIWYSAVPGEQNWMIVRGLSTHKDHMSPWGWVALVLLFGRFLIPFFGLMSRYVKRRKPSLAFWAVWLLVMQWIDMWWLVMPSFDPGGDIPVPIIEILCLIGVGGLFLAAAVRLAARHSLVAVGDPRLNEALHFHNI